jgi:hypothetical protein
MVCEDEGFDSDREPSLSRVEGSQFHGGASADDRDLELCNWQDEGDQTVLRQLPVYSKRTPGIRPSWANVSMADAVPVKVL